MVPQGILLQCRVSRGRPQSNRAELRGKICADAICQEPAFSSLLYAPYRPVDTIVYGPDGGRMHRDNPRRSLLFPLIASVQNALCYNGADPPKLSRRYITPGRKGTIDAMADLIDNEEELKLLRPENQTLRDQANLQEETIDLLREQIGLKDQLIAALQRETTLLTQQVQGMQEQLEKAGYGNLMSSSSVRFSRPPKSLWKKSSKKRR